jgi:hypothetical protein
MLSARAVRAPVTARAAGTTLPYVNNMSGDFCTPADVSYTNDTQDGLTRLEVTVRVSAVLSLSAPLAVPEGLLSVAEN